MSQAAHPNCPLALAGNDNVVNFAAVDDSAFIFAKMPATANVRAELDELYADHEFDFETARHSSTVDLEHYNGDYDMLFIYN
jgi:hypothetical protein